jgi:hypothetical protein
VGTGAAGRAAGRGFGQAGRAGAAGRAGTGRGAAGSPATGAAGRTAAGGGGAAAVGGRAGTGGSAAGGVTFTQVYAVLKSGCSCHVTMNAASMSFSDKMTAYNALVGVDADVCKGEKRVVAGDAASSVLAHAVDHTNLGSCTVTPMPPGGMLTAAQVEQIKSWIQAGAMND